MFLALFEGLRIQETLPFLRILAPSQSREIKKQRFNSTYTSLIARARVESHREMLHQ